VALFSIFQQWCVIIFINALLWHTQKGSCAHVGPLSLCVVENSPSAIDVCKNSIRRSGQFVIAQFTHTQSALHQTPHNFLLLFCRLFALCFES
jgi:hypothetical protein